MSPKVVTGLPASFYLRLEQILPASLLETRLIRELIPSPSGSAVGWRVILGENFPDLHYADDAIAQLCDRRYRTPVEQLFNGESVDSKDNGLFLNVMHEAVARHGRIGRAEAHLAPLLGASEQNIRQWATGELHAMPPYRKTIYAALQRHQS
jgi:hypothetical protein